MRLTEVFQMDEEKIIATLRNGENTAVFKNPTPEELRKIGMNGVVKGILTPSNFIGYDFNNVQLRDLPPINGFPVIIFLVGHNEISIELFQGVNISKDAFEKTIRANAYLKKFNIKQIIWHKDEIE